MKTKKQGAHKARTKKDGRRALAVRTGSASGGIPLFSGLSDTVTPRRVRGGIIFWWTRKDVGIGSLTLTVNRGKLVVDAECMGPDFCASIVKQAVVEATQPNTPVSHGLSEAKDVAL